MAISYAHAFLYDNSIFVIHFGIVFNVISFGYNVVLYNALLCVFQIAEDSFFILHVLHSYPGLLDHSHPTDPYVTSLSEISVMNGI